MNKIVNSHIDLSSLKNDMDGDMGICKELIELFIIDIDEFVHTMNSQLKNNNWPALYHVTHKILPCIRIFGIDKLEPIIIQLEKNLREQDDLESIHNHIKSSLNIFEKVKVELHTELKLIDDAAT